MICTRHQWLLLTVLFCFLLGDSKARGLSLSVGSRNKSCNQNLSQLNTLNLSNKGGHGFERKGKIVNHNKSTSVLGLSMIRGGNANGKNQNKVLMLSTLSESAPSSQENKLRGRLTLLFVAFLFGTLNVTLRFLYATPGPPSPSALSATRGWLAAACFLPLYPRIRRETETIDTSENQQNKRSLFFAALELAVWNLGAQGLVNVGLLFTGSARASFLTQTSVVITPLISLLAGQSISRNTWAGCGVALAGLVLLSSGGGAAVSGAMSSLALRFSTGDLLVLGGAVCWSMYIFRVSSISNRYPEVPLQATKTVLLAGLYTVWLSSSVWSCYHGGGGWTQVRKLWLGWSNLKVWAALAFSAIGPGALGDVLQQRGQKEVSASEANVILCSEPVFTAILAYLTSGEVTSQRETAGGGLIILAAILASSTGAA